MKLGFVGIFLFGLGVAFSYAGERSEEKANILFIAVDDMNDWVGFLGGHSQARTPNMDRLAQRGVNFTNAHCVSPACSPSRNAVLFGVEPFNSGLYPFYDIAKVPEDVLESYTSLPRFLREKGYGTYGAGKIHHASIQRDQEWSEYLKPKEFKLTYNAEEGYQQGNSRKMAFCPTLNPLEEHPDYQVASYGIEVLERKHEKPFFLALGIVKPHLPFVCPQEFFDLYPHEIEPPLVNENDLDDIPWSGRAMASIKDDLRFRTDNAWNDVWRSYLACISWVDYNVGRILNALENSQHAKNTVVVLWSDHGYGMGEKRHFRKFSLWEESTRVPFVIWDTRQTNAESGREVDQAVSLINIYRTIAEYAGLKAPPYVDGESLGGLMNDQETLLAYPAITTWGRGNYAVREGDWRYIQYFDGGEELYFHKQDSREWNNLASNPEYASVKGRLAKRLPKSEAPLVKEGIRLWNVVDADKPSLEKTKSRWLEINEKIQPPLGD